MTALRTRTRRRSLLPPLVLRPFCLSRAVAEFLAHTARLDKLFAARPAFITVLTRDRATEEEGDDE